VRVQTPMERVLSSRTFRSGRLAKMTYSETDEPDATHQVSENVEAKSEVLFVDGGWCENSRRP
jgi:hypothetical protein